MGNTMRCRLVGGPFDGDQGAMEQPLPEQLWAVECPRGARCALGGTHWLLHDEGQGERYRRDVLKAGVQLYVHGDLEPDADPGLTAKRREPVAA